MPTVWRQLTSAVLVKELELLKEIKELTGLSPKERRHVREITKELASRKPIK